MMPYKMFPMFKVGFLHFNLYGVMFALGVLMALYLAIKVAERKGLDKEIVYGMFLYALIGGLIGARLFYVLFYWPVGMPLGFFDAFKIWEGGIAFFGGFLGGALAVYIYTRKHKLDFLRYADILTVPLVIGHILGRIGDYLTGGHPGKASNLPWAIYTDNALRHPVVLYEIIGLVIIAIILLNLKKLKLFDGFIFAGYLMLYAAQRLFLDYFRIESTDPRFVGLTPSQFASAALFTASAVFMMIKFKNIKYPGIDYKRGEPYEQA